MFEILREGFHGEARRGCRRLTIFPGRASRSVVLRDERFLRRRKLRIGSIACLARQNGIVAARRQRKTGCGNEYQGFENSHGDWLFEGVGATELKRGAICPFPSDIDVQRKG